MRAEMEGFREKFLRFYNNLPEEEVDQPIVVLDGDTYSWRSAKHEVEAGTEKGEEILNQINEMNILGEGPIDADDEKHLKLAKERLKTMPYYLEVSIAREGQIRTFGKEELEDHLEEGDDIGKEFARLQVDTIRSLGE